MKRIVIALLIVFGVSHTAIAQEDYERRLELAREVVAVSGASEASLLMLESLSPSLEPAFRQQYPNANDKAIANAVKHIIARFEDAMPEILEGTAAVYARKFTADELSELLEFYETPLGQKLLAEQVAIMNETSQAGQQIGIRIMTEAQSDIEQIMTE